MSDWSTVIQKVVQCINEHGDRYEAIATNDAVDFARKPEDDKRRERALRSVAISDALNQMARDLNQVIPRILDNAFREMDKASKEQA